MNSQSNVLSCDSKPLKTIRTKNIIDSDDRNVNKYVENKIVFTNIPIKSIQIYIGSFNRDSVQQNITMKDYNFEYVKKIKYFRAVMWKDLTITKKKSKTENKWETNLILISKDTTSTTKIKIYRTISKQNELGLKSFERTILRRILAPISPKTHQYKIRRNAKLEEVYKDSERIREV